MTDGIPPRDDDSVFEALVKRAQFELSDRELAHERITTEYNRLSERVIDVGEVIAQTEHGLLHSEGVSLTLSQAT